MEDDVEVELELEKQLALAHELFPTWPKSGLPPNWWQVNGDTDQNEKEITVEFSRDEVAENNGIENGINGVSQADSSDHNKYHKYSPLNIGPVPAHI